MRAEMSLDAAVVIPNTTPISEFVDKKERIFNPDKGENYIVMRTTVHENLGL
jgi:hypothetical protein